MKWMGSGAVAVLLGALVPACTPTTEATGFIFSYGIGAFGCDTPCATPGAATIDSAARGDTVWLQHTMVLVAAVDSFTPQFATLRPDCAGHVAVLSGTATVRTLPTPTCNDSTYGLAFQLANVDYPQTLIAYTQWVVDSDLVPGAYLLRGRVLVRPRLEPVLGFTVQ
jgi:hypothetical protein